MTHPIETFLDKIICGDCLEVMKYIPEKSIDMIICDLPYGVTARNAWDIIIPFDKLWENYKRIIKDKGVIVLTATQPFASRLIMSNLEMFRYDLIWDKKSVTGFLNAKRMPLRRHENILVFYKSLPLYNPIKVKGVLIKKCTMSKQTSNYNDASNRPKAYMSDEYYPTSILDIPNPRHKNGHPTQKPVELGRYFIRTYTNEGEIVLDNTCGSGSFLVAAKMENRHFIGIEISQEYCKIAEERLKAIPKKLDLGQISI